MNWHAIRAITSKDMLIVRRSRAILLPLILVPFLMLVVVPLSVVLVAQNTEAASQLVGELDGFADRLPASINESLDALENDGQRMIVLVTVYLMAPLYLVVPIMVATVVAADSFAGEKERKTLEALLYSPTTDRELLFGKLLSAWLPAVVVGFASVAIYGVVINAAGWPVMGKIFFPTPMWLLMTFWLGPAIAGLALGLMVFVSSRVGTFQEAYQLGGIVVLPLVLLVVGQAMGFLYFSGWIVAVLGLVIWLINIGIIAIALRRFRRERILLDGL